MHNLWFKLHRFDLKIYICRWWTNVFSFENDD